MKTTGEALAELNEISTGWELLYDGSQGIPAFYVFSNNYIKMTYYYDDRYIAEHGAVRYNDDRSMSGDFQHTAHDAYESLKNAMNTYAQNILNLVIKM
ncbi:hypothetical protein [Yersinia phage fHe-Yen9-04]|uniref:Uncharacterized protein n=2 Tax=Eneladusvirus Yen904 TaxID=2560849 RepID=A0A2C9D014_9CAUD|nr:hypothetical protein FDJ41_gp355 [Yersinia phage fHe-Yen9-04]SOK58632.1 hypothetical protein [Yersinia phage fHe-Yen9-04]SOK59164.1 hypothetical protein [Yersinia phage fHe-Yen9-03]VUE36401.1 hypothetical protein [Yersinia phage fHe-Yen9-04]